ncbi:hypothetical protein BKA67DRAFT_529561 [Truncatella angustata]|uniref:Uncharacterized protein n=1 Tax=Truncatella angustata TaxID=152316 RepID=A0A9P8UUJ0_9PEZI|nr:uncharacterized protein BKA67DRAFT_529561 [Truncatella angustata]KAH6659409.1 hypothetical protein BKA67DRAFT_529561 [Truncatella angustata]
MLPNSKGSMETTSRPMRIRFLTIRITDRFLFCRVSTTRGQGSHFRIGPNRIMIIDLEALHKLAKIESDLCRGHSPYFKRFLPVREIYFKSCYREGQATQTSSHACERRTSSPIIDSSLHIKCDRAIGFVLRHFYSSNTASRPSSVAELAMIYAANIVPSLCYSGIETCLNNGLDQKRRLNVSAAIIELVNSLIQKIPITIRSSMQTQYVTGNDDVSDVSDVLSKAQTIAKFSTCTVSIAKTLQHILIYFVSTRRIYQKLRAEVGSIPLDLVDTELLENHLRGLRYLHVIVQEGFRLRPVGADLSLKVSKTGEFITGYHVPGGGDGGGTEPYRSLTVEGVLGG